MVDPYHVAKIQLFVERGRFHTAHSACQLMIDPINNAQGFGVYKVSGHQLCLRLMPMPSAHKSHLHPMCGVSNEILDFRQQIRIGDPSALVVGGANTRCTPMRVNGMACTLYNDEADTQRVQQYQVFDQPASDEFGAHNIRQEHNKGLVSELFDVGSGLSEPGD
jgi:hypothetical protein